MFTEVNFFEIIVFMHEKYVLILFASKTGSTYALAKSVLRGANSVPGISGRLRTVQSVSELMGKVPVGNQEVPVVTVDDLAGASAVALGSPTQFSNMTSGLQYFLEQTSGLWMQGALVDKPLTVFTSSASLHGGQETTLMNMITPFLHHGMVIVGMPYTHPELSTTTTGGTPYGASHVESPGGVKRDLDAHEHKLAMAQGKRLASMALKLEA